MHLLGRHLLKYLRAQCHDTAQKNTHTQEADSVIVRNYKLHRESLKLTREC